MRARLMRAVCFAALATLPLAAQSGRAVTERPLFDVVEASIPQLQAALTAGRLTSRELVFLYLARIARYEHTLNAVMAVSPTALAEADALDRERASGRVRGPLHGIPVALKDNIHTTNMPTTGGALAFKGMVPPYEATLTKNLKDAGAIIIGKTVLTELANWVAGYPTPMVGNYSALGGYGMNPYDPRRDPRPGFNDGRPVMGVAGSSSGIGTAASLWAASVGTETSGSILSPSNQTMLIGIKPTVGRVSRYGVIPISADQDTPGPMARSVEDAAIMLGALEGGSPDPNDPATRTCAPPANRDYRTSFKRDGLKGARIGVPRAFFYDATAVPGSTELRGGLTPEQKAVMAEAIKALEKEGAVIVDPASIPSIVITDPAKNFLRWNICSGVENRKGHDADCSVDFKYRMKKDFNAWLATLGSTTQVKSVTDLRYFNLAHVQEGAIKYGQSQLDISDEMDLEMDRARYEADRKKDLELAGSHGIKEIMETQHLDALLFPGSSGAAIAARPGYPSIIVPFGRVPNAPTPPLPDGYAAQPQPFGVTFTGLSCSEPRLIELAYSFEQATKKRTPPTLP
jgi:amidase